MQIRYKRIGSILHREKDREDSFFQGRAAFGGRSGFKKALLAEYTGDLPSPGIGWYHVYTFVLEQDSARRAVEEEVWLDADCRMEHLALLLIDIGHFRACSLSGEALERIRDILEFFRGQGKQMIVRFVYDREGQGRDREPAGIDQVMEHMEQAGGILRDYLASILVVQGIFVGNWGEMHGSRFLGEEDLCELLNCIYRATGGGCFLAVRTPAQWRMAAGCRWLAPGLIEKLGLFNDGIFGSVTDLGTYGMEGGQRERLKELAWQERQVSGTPNGGEVLMDDSGPVSCMQAAGEMARMHIGYLNSVHQKEQLDHWKGEEADGKGCWQGVSGYAYIGRHLGYRFVIRDAWVKKDYLYVLVENCGFANLCQEAECFLVAEGAGSSSRLIKTDARMWESGRNTVITSQLWEEEKKGRLYLYLRLKQDHCVIPFANQGAADKVLLGEFADG